MLEKLGLFLTYFYIAEDVIYIHTAGVALSQVTNAIKALKKSNPNFKVKVISTVDDAAKGVSVMADLSERFPGFESLVTRIGGSASKSEIYPALQKIAKGDWIKVYQGGHINGKATEIHYYLHKESGQIANPKIKYSRQVQNVLKDLGY